MRLSVDFGWTTGRVAQVPSLGTLLSTHLVGRGASRKLEREMPRSGRAKSITFFETSKVKKKGAEALLMSQMKVPRAGFRDFDLKSRFSFGTLKIVGRWNISKIKSTF